MVKTTNIMVVLTKSNWPKRDASKITNLNWSFHQSVFTVEWRSLDEGAYTQRIHNRFTRSHPSEEENRTRNRGKNCKCKRALRRLDSLFKNSGVQHFDMFKLQI